MVSVISSQSLKRDLLTVVSYTYILIFNPRPRRKSCSSITMLLSPILAVRPGLIIPGRVEVQLLPQRLRAFGGVRPHKAPWRKRELRACDRAVPRVVPLVVRRGVVHLYADLVRVARVDVIIGPRVHCPCLRLISSGVLT
jgi:hypothetical protein